MRPIHTLVWHCTATPEGREFTRGQIRQMHLARGFSDIGYHRIIHLDGRVEQGRPDDVIGAHVAGHNTGTLGFSYIGGLDGAGRAKDTRTAAQREAMERLTRETLARYPTIRAVVGHRDLSPDLDGDGVVEPAEWVKVCPCFDAAVEYGPLLSARSGAPVVVPSPAVPGLVIPAQMPPGDVVRLVQALANRLGAGLAVDGKYRRQTREALARVLG